MAIALSRVGPISTTEQFESKTPNFDAVPAPTIQLGVDSVKFTPALVGSVAGKNFRYNRPIARVFPTLGLEVAPGKILNVSVFNPLAYSVQFAIQLNVESDCSPADFPLQLAGRLKMAKLTNAGRITRLSGLIFLDSGRSSTVSITSSEPCFGPPHLSLVHVAIDWRSSKNQNYESNYG
jgi:hypothetical protein